jgi:hypothetical protein
VTRALPRRRWNRQSTNAVTMDRAVDLQDSLLFTNAPARALQHGFPLVIERIRCCGHKLACA